MKKSHLNLLFFLIITTVVLLNCSVVYAENEADEQSVIINEQLKSDEIKSIKKEIQNSANEDFEKLVPSFDPEVILKQAASGKFKPQLIPFISKALSYLLNEVYTNINIMVKLLVIIIFCSILRQLQSSFMSESVGELAFYVCYAVIVAVMVVSLNTTMNLGKEHSKSDL